MFSAGASRWKVKAHDLIWSWRGLFWVSESFITSTVGSLCFWQELCLPLLKNLTTEPVRFGLALEDQELATVQATKEYSTDMYRLDQCSANSCERQETESTLLCSCSGLSRLSIRCGSLAHRTLLPLACGCSTSQQWRICPRLNEWKAIRFIPLS